MRVFKPLVMITILFLLCFGAKAQDKEDLERRRVWINANMFTKQDAIDFITLTYKDFTVFISKKETETGIFKREVKLKGCELIIETDSRTQESSWKSDHEYEKYLVVIELDKVKMDGFDVKPSSPENANGLFAGKSFASSKKIPSYSVLSGVTEKENERFTRLHYDEHLAWAFQFLIDQCSAGDKK